MYEITMEERAIQAQEVMFHPLHPKPVQLDMEKEVAIASLLEKSSIHKRWPFGLKGPSLKKKEEFSKKILEVLDSPKKTPFSVILAATIAANGEAKDGLSANPKDSKIETFSFEPKREEAVIPEILSFGSMDVEPILKRDAEECVKKEETKNPAPETINRIIDNLDGEIIQETEPRQRVELKEKERLRPLVEREGLKDTSNEEASIFSFTPSFDGGMMEEAEKNFRGLVYELVRGVQILKGESRMGLCLQLHPEQFGRMEVQLIMDEKKGIHIKFVVVDPKAQASILSGLNLLKDNLLEAGVDVKGIEVEIRDDSKIKEEDLEGFHLRQIPLRDLAGRLDYVA